MRRNYPLAPPRREEWAALSQLPFWDVVAWVNAELLHHGAEIGLLRDLHLSRGDPGHP